MPAPQSAIPADAESVMSQEEEEHGAAPNFMDSLSRQLVTHQSRQQDAHHNIDRDLAPCLSIHRNPLHTENGWTRYAADDIS